MLKITKSLAIIAIAVAAVAGATYAYLSDQVKVLGSTFSAGTLDLMIDKNSDGNSYEWANEITMPDGFVKNLYPGYPSNSEHNWQVIDLKNVGEVEGKVSINLHRTSAWNELPDNLVFTVYFDGDNDNFADSEDKVARVSGTLAQFEGNTYPLGQFTGSSNELGGKNGKMASVKIVWSVPASAGNNIQGDNVTIDTTFGLDQVH